MPRFVPAQTTPVASKVPAVGVLFWVIKILTTGMGEAASDYLASLNLGLAALVGAGGFYYAIRLQFRADHYRAQTYWFAVGMVAVFGTMVADGSHVLGLPYVATVSLYLLLTLGILLRWYRSEGTLSIHSITTARRERLYWGTVLATFALGTALGDMSATTLHLGFFSSGLIFAGAIVVPAIAWRLGLNPIVAFWVAYVLTRPLGASFADWLGKPHSINGGIGLGDGPVALGALILILGLVTYVATAGRDRATQAEAESRMSSPIR